MKQMLLCSVLIFAATLALGQYKDNVFVDADINGSVGGSATYNHRLKEHLGIGGGLQVLPLNNSAHKALFADLRKYRIKNKHAWIFFVDLGFDFFKDKTISRYNPADNAVYAGVGYGYFHAINTKGQGLYATLRLTTDSQIIYADNPHSPRSEAYSLDGQPVLSIGFKF